MTNEFETVQSVPTLTLEPFGDAAETKEAEAVKQEIFAEQILTVEEKAQVTAFAKQIDLTNSTVILQYGAGTQKKMADFSDRKSVV